MAASQTYKFATKLRSRDDESIDMTVAQLLDHLIECEEKKEIPVLYEAIYGPCVPYYDFDHSYPDQDSQEANADLDFAKAVAAVQAKWGPNARYLWRASHGHDPTKAAKGQDSWKNSFHCIVRGCGYYRQGADIPRVTSSDDTVYKQAGKRQLFRTLGATKELNKRPAQRLLFINETWVQWSALDYSDGIKAGAFDEKFEENLIQYIGTERLREPEARPVAIPEAKHTARPVKSAKSDGRKVSVEEIRAHIANMKPTRPSRTSPARHKVVWALANYATELGIDLRAEAHQFRRLDSKDYDEQGGLESTEKCYAEANTERGVKSGIQTILAMSKEDNEEKYQEIVQKFINADAVSIDQFDCFTDYNKMTGKLVTLDTIKAWASATIVTIIGKKKMYLIKHLEGDIRDDSIRNIGYNIVCLKDLRELCDISVKCLNPLYSPSGKAPLYLTSLTDVVEYLVSTEQAIPRYNGFDFFPWNKVQPPKTVKCNLFTGFEMAQYKPREEVKFIGSAWYNHLWVDFCGEDRVDPGLFKYFMQTIGYMIQFPGRRPEMFGVLCGPPGTGKTRWGMFITRMLGAQYCLTYERAADMFENFNSLQERKIFIFTEELGEQTELNRHEQQFKAMVTADKHKITFKGVDSFEAINCIHMWAACNPEKFAHMPGDERRTFTLKISDAHANDRKYFAPIEAELNNRDYIKAAYDHFTNMDLSDYDPGRVFVTEFKRKRQSEDMPLPLKHLKWKFTEENAKVGEPAVPEVVMHTEPLFFDYKDWAAKKEEAKTNLNRSSYVSMMGTFGIKQLPAFTIENMKRVGYKITRLQAETAIRNYLKNPGWQLE
jgi:hypothetical protein